MRLLHAGDGAPAAALLADDPEPDEDEIWGLASRVSAPPRHKFPRLGHQGRLRLRRWRSPAGSVPPPPVP